MIFLSAWLVRESVLIHSIAYCLNCLIIILLYLYVIEIFVGEMLVVVVLVPGYTLVID